MRNMNTKYNDIMNKFELNIVLCHVGMSWTTRTNQQLKYHIKKHNPYRITGYQWYNKYICEKIYQIVFENYIINERTDRFKLICYIDAHEKHHTAFVYADSSGGGNALPSNMTT